jgi:hypothetical protein
MHRSKDPKKQPRWPTSIEAWVAFGVWHDAATKHLYDFRRGILINGKRFRNDIKNMMEALRASRDLSFEEEDKAKLEKKTTDKEPNTNV